MTISGIPGQLPVKRERRFAILPTTYLGKWALGLAAAGIVLLLGWSLLGRLGGLPGLFSAFVGGLVALVAILRRGERAGTVFAALVPFVIVLAFVLGELLGHE